MKKTVTRSSVQWQTVVKRIKELEYQQIRNLRIVFLWQILKTHQGRPHFFFPSFL